MNFIRFFFYFMKKMTFCSDSDFFCNFGQFWPAPPEFLSNFFSRGHTNPWCRPRPCYGPTPKSRRFLKFRLIENYFINKSDSFMGFWPAPPEFLHNLFGQGHTNHFSRPRPFYGPMLKSRRFFKIRWVKFTNK